MRALGAELIEHGRDFDEAREHAALLARERGMRFVGPFDWKKTSRSGNARRFARDGSGAVAAQNFAYDGWKTNLDASGSTAFGEALSLLEQRVDSEVRKTTEQQKGDWKPLVFIMTDGQPTDSWEAAADRIKQKRFGNIIACAAGSGADKTPLKRVADTVVELNSLQPDALKAFFKWVSSSIKTTSYSLDQVVADAPVTLPPPPPQVVVVP